jgi:hypothetical protein
MSGYVTIYAPEGIDAEQRLAERALIAATSEAYCGWRAGNAYGSDRRQIYEAVLLCRAPGAQQLYRAALKQRAAQFVSRPRFRELARQVTDAVLDAGGVLKGDALREVLRLSVPIRTCMDCGRPSSGTKFGGYFEPLELPDPKEAR